MASSRLHRRDGSPALECHCVVLYEGITISKSCQHSPQIRATKIAPPKIRDGKLTIAEIQVRDLRTRDCTKRGAARQGLLRSGVHALHCSLHPLLPLRPGFPSVGIMLGQSDDRFPLFNGNTRTHERQKGKTGRVDDETYVGMITEWKVNSPHRTGRRSSGKAVHPEAALSRGALSGYYYVV